MQAKDLLEEAIAEIVRAKHDRKHPFRNIVLSTVSEEAPDSRIVVLRDFSRDKMIFQYYTDRRSAKYLHIKSNPKVHLLFWHPARKLQVRISGEAKEIDGEEKYSKLTEQSKRDYNSTEAPGTSFSEDIAAFRDVLTQNILLCTRFQHWDWMF